MTQDATRDTAQTRMIFMGEAPLTDGFRLIGFETWADPSVAEVETVVRQLVNRHQSALVVLDQALAEANIPVVNRVRAEGGRIVITAVPPLNAADSFHTLIDERLNALFGGDTPA